MLHNFQCYRLHGSWIYLSLCNHFWEVNRTNNTKENCKQTGKRKQDPKHTIPLNRKALSKIKRKERLWTKYLNTRDGEAYNEYCKVRNQVRTLTRKITKQFEKQIAQEVKTNPKKFWKYARSKTKTKSSIPDLFKDDNKTESTNSDKEKAKY